MTKLYFRYLLFELIKPFLFCLIAFSALWLIADLLGSLDDFIQLKAPWPIIFEFYLVQIPRMLTLVLPITFLFSTLYTLLSLTRHNETVSLQAAGLSWAQLYSPFLWVGIIVWFGLLLLVTGPASQAEARRAAIQDQLRNHTTRSPVKKNLPYYDLVKRQAWYLQTLDPVKGRAEGIEITQLDDLGRDQMKCFAQSAQWNGRHWVLTQVKQLTFSPLGDIQSDVLLPTFQGIQFTSSPRQLALLQSRPDELNFRQLLVFLDSANTRSKLSLAPYRTQLHQQLAYPFMAVVLLLFALAFCGHTSRRNPAVGVFNAIFILLGYFFVMHFFLAMGRSARLPALLAAWSTPLIFTGIGSYLLARRTGFWQGLFRGF